MPIHLPVVSRRDFFRTTAATAAGVLMIGQGEAAEDVTDADFLALLADTHVPSDRTIAANGANMTENLEHVIQELLALEVKPAGIVINGDCAFLKGLTEDYTNLGATLVPLREAKLPIHLTMGNHDHRPRMYEQLQWQQPHKPVVTGKHVSVLRMPRANWFLLDSLMETDVVTGELGQAQLGWLLQAIEMHADKPAILVAHHHPQWQAEGPISGLRETKELFAEVSKRSHVKAYVFGHTHRWETKEHEGIHLVNLPPTAYVFDKSRPNGWVSAHVSDKGMTLRLSALDKNHEQHHQRVDLAWR